MRRLSVIVAVTGLLGCESEWKQMPDTNVSRVQAETGRSSTPECPSEPQPVQLMGRLVSEERFGPPGYGETPDRDARVEIYVLALDQPRDICPETDPSRRREWLVDVDRIQVTGPRSATELKRYVGARVAVTGILDRAVWGGDFTPVVMRASHIAAAGPVEGGAAAS